MQGEGSRRCETQVKAGGLLRSEERNEASKSTDLSCGVNMVARKDLMLPLFSPCSTSHWSFRQNGASWQELHATFHVPRGRWQKAYSQDREREAAGIRALPCHMPPLPTPTPSLLRPCSMSPGRATGPGFMWMWTVGLAAVESGSVVV